jgi:hypothetical protein
MMFMIPYRVLYQLSKKEYDNLKKDKILDISKIWLF